MEYESITKARGINIVPEWQKFSEKLTRNERIILIGDIDSGKTTFCNFLKNKFKNTAIFDFDPGQQNLFLPSTVSAKHKNKFMKFFIGRFSPRGAENLILLSLSIFTREMIRRRPNLMILDTSGYVGEDRAVFLKFAKCLIFNPTKVVIIRSEKSENLIYIDKIKNVISGYFQVFEIPSSQYTRSITKEEREEIRRKKFQMYFSETDEIEILKSENTKIINLDFYPQSEGTELIGFFKNKQTDFLGLVVEENENILKVKVPKHYKNWDFIIRSGLRVKI